ncbi:MAG: HAMP domain-containing histidine kinase [Acidimicrobiia bacterium]|nr:HAMP domain-containing histidine kinase [Acidimicrobiia bacterium]
MRQRLTVVVGLVILVVCAVIAVTVAVASRSVLIERVDEDLLALASRPLPRPGPGDPPPGDDSFQPFGLVVFNTDGEVLVDQPGGFASDPEPLPDLGGLTLDDLREGGFVTLDAAGGDGSVRVLIRTTPGGFEMLTRSLDSVDTSARQTVAISLVVGLVAALVGVAAASLELRRGFRPIDDMIETAGAIADGDLNRRTDLVESDTELGRLATALDHMLEQIETADRERLREAERLRRFADDASHELRTPIAAIAGYAELFEAGGIEPGAGLDRAMTRIREASDRAGRLIEDLLALARLDREIGISRSELDIGALVTDIAEEARMSSSRDIRSDVPGPVLVDGDSVWLRQAIDNLVSNAVANAPERSPIELLVRAEGDHALVLVVDHGPGIPEAERERVFDRFARPDSARDRSHGGAGLGLAIVREVVLSHEGDVSIRETPGGGATVQMRLPLAPSPSRMA